ncbi:recombinase family protein [Phaeovibrio sulfidiphilus]|uniref:Recombinase family protein n=1 Tax=Phaeovibrio sulfidiphilus TaxID=1220600 RepID=A0A8J7CWE9_9PROT|nr:recombinase family protein [Phaeovibrio sulfidiphilus]MBE1237396.1 recombinase family protein [Phaeovibrio sulfidiphilus]
MTLAIYARYSSDLQNPTSIEDQIALCRAWLRSAGEDDSAVRVFTDAACSGATWNRPGLADMLEALAKREISGILCEGLDRLSRSLADIARIFELANFANVPIRTVQEGLISELHIGLKGTMNALFLSDLKNKIRRGQEGRTRAGYVMGGAAYGYSVVRGVTDERGRYINGLREIVPHEAATVRRIFQEYAEGRTPTEIVADLNAEGVPSPRKPAWRISTLDNPSKPIRHGILNNPIYVGQVIFNRSRRVLNPSTGALSVQPNDPSAWVVVERPELRIIDDATWARVQERLISQKISKPQKKRARYLEDNRINTHNQHPLTGWVVCGVCSGPKTIGNSTRYVCSNYRVSRSCRNARGVREAVLLDEAFLAIERRLAEAPPLRPTLEPLIMARCGPLASLHKEETDVKAAIENYIDAIGRGLDRDLVVERIRELQIRQKEIHQLLRRSEIPLPSEDDIRSSLYRLIIGLSDGKGNRRATRILFECTLERIVLTPIPGKAHGETVEVVLRSDPDWATVWDQVIQNADTGD